MGDEHYHACHMKCVCGFADVVPTARAERAEAAIQRVRELVDSYPHGSDFARSGLQDLFRVVLDSTETGEAAPAYRWRVQFISTPQDGVEEEMGRYDFADEAAARAAFAEYVAEYRTMQFWRVELRRQRVTDWETVEDGGYAPAALDSTQPDTPAPGRSGEFSIDEWVLVDVGPVTQQRGQVVQIVRADDGSAWEYDVRVRDGDVVAAQPKHVHADYTHAAGLPVDGEERK